MISHNFPNVTFSDGGVSQLLKLGFQKSENKFKVLVIGHRDVGKKAFIDALETVDKD